MACNSPLAAWQPPEGRLRFHPPAITDASYEALRVSCGRCLGCRKAKARAWAFRCRLEFAQCEEACWATLTYSERYKPPTLSKWDFSSYLKRLRSRTGTGVRFFGCGEYGDRSARPHYHVILFGLSRYNPAIEAAWGMGRVQVDPLSPAAINYVAGYTAKKIGLWDQVRSERVDKETGEVYTYQPPFLQMSRRPGIGGSARQFSSSWRDFAVSDGRKIPVPRYLHDAWRAQASEEELATHKQAQQARAVVRTWAQMEADEALASSYESLTNLGRSL